MYTLHRLNKSLTFKKNNAFSKKRLKVKLKLKSIYFTSTLTLNIFRICEHCSFALAFITLMHLPSFSCERIIANDLPF